MTAEGLVGARARVAVGGASECNGRERGSRGADLGESDNVDRG